MTNNEIRELASRFLAGYGIAGCPVDLCSKSLAASSRKYDAPMRLLTVTADPDTALNHLSLLSWPATRHVLFRAGDRCSALINNSRNGSDYADYKIWLARHLGTRFARVVCSRKRVWSNGVEREILRYEASILEIYDRDGELIRSVICADDGGRWDFSEHGTPHPIESSFPYDARRKRDRFTTAHLRQLISAYGLTPVTAESFLAGDEYHLFDTPGRPADTCTIAEADDPAHGYYKRGLTWVPRMETHASSVIADFERCIRINPEYEPRVRAALDIAYRVVGRQ